ncbi:MAG: Gfo/Idh/MocA family oxidoreductase, partial [Planctomycetota bacterium]
SGIDAVVVATCNHWHCLATIWAIQAGKDVYVEKPLSHNQFEGAAVVRAAKENNRIVQIGTQQRSDPLQAQARDFLHGKKALGEIQFVVACRMGQRKPIGKKSQPIKIDSNVDYDLWCGPAEKRGLVRDKMHYDWHWDWNTGNGEMGNWGVHILDDVRNVAYQDSVTTPTAITAAGSRVAWDDAGNTPNLHVAVIETETFPTFMALSNLAAAPGEPKKGWSLRAELPQNLPGSGYAVVCDGGVYYGQRGSGRAVDSLGDTIKKFGEGKRDTVLMHARAFINAVQSRDASLLNAPIDQGHYSSGWCNLANVAVRAAAGNVDESIHEASDFGVWSLILDEMANQLAPFRVSPESIRFSQRLKHDPKTERFVGDGSSTANEFMTRSFRKGFVVS